jgi:glycerophosphoryl diester phosphodiesterase
VNYSIWGLFLMVISASCATPQNVKPKMPFRALFGPLIIAHRGGSLEAPENTVTAIRHGIEVGSDWQEIDVTLSADGIPVVIHDDTLERTTNGHGLVEALPLRILQTLKAGPHDMLPTLDDILAIQEARLMIEIKQSSRRELLVRQVLECIRRARAEDRVGIASFDFDALDQVARTEPSLPLIAVIDTLNMFDKMLELPIAVLAVDTAIIDQVLAQAQPTLAIWTWTVYNTQQALALTDKGVHGLITDVPAAVVHALRDQHD